LIWIELKISMRDLFDKGLPFSVRAVRGQVSLLMYVCKHVGISVIRLSVRSNSEMFWLTSKQSIMFSSPYVVS